MGVDMAGRSMNWDGRHTDTWVSYICRVCGRQFECIQGSLTEETKLCLWCEAHPESDEPAPAPEEQSRPGSGDPRDDNLTLDGQVARQQQRANERAEVSRLWAEDWDSPEDAVYDKDAEDAAGECHHGCNGVPCGSERCTFLCHQGVPDLDR